MIGLYAVSWPGMLAPLFLLKPFRVFMTILSVDREMRLRGGWWLQLMSGGRSNVPAMPGSERIMNSKSTGKFEWKCVSGVLVLGIRLDGN